MSPATTLGVITLLASQAAAFLALLLIASAIHKLLWPARARAAMEEFARVPRRFANPALAGVLLAELVAGVCMGFPAARTAAAWLAALIWTSYLLLILRAIIQGRRYVDCGCSFGASARPLGAYQALRGVVLIGLALLVAALSAHAAGAAPTATELLAAAAFLALYAALDQVLAAPPVAAGVRR
jgi:hypothetical protein